MKQYKLKLGLENDSIKLHGIGSQIRAAATLIQKASLQGDEVVPEMVVNGQDIYPLIFKRNTNPISDMEICPCDSLNWSPAEEIAHAGAARTHLSWSDQWKKRCQKKLQSIGSPTAVLSLRETDKIDGGEMVLPTVVYQDLINKSEEPVLVLSDSSWSLPELASLPNCRTLERTMSHSLFPIHRTRYLDRGIISKAELLNHTLEMFEDIYILGSMKTVFYPVWHGVLSAGMLLAENHPKLICLQDSLNSREKQFVNYYCKREVHFWNFLDK